MMRRLHSLAALPPAFKLASQLRNIPADWQAQTDANLRRMAAYAYQHTRFYRQLWDAAHVNPGLIHGVADLPRLPIISRAQWRAAPADTIEVSRFPFLGARDVSGGTTGTRFSTSYNWSDVVQHRALIMALYMNYGLHWFDLIPWDPLARSPTHRLWRHAGRVLTISLRIPPADILPLIHKLKPRVVRGSPWPLWRAVIGAIRAGQPIPKIPFLVLSGEVVTPTVRRTLQACIAERVIDHYGATDSGHIASECRAGRLHIGWPTSHIEILDGDRPTPPGEEGEVVVTNFALSRRPLLRVGTGDRAAWGAGTPCPCGSPLPYLAYMAGRDGDRVVLPDNSKVSWPALEAALADDANNVLGYQCEQLNDNQAIIRLCLLNPLPDKAPIERRLRATLPGIDLAILLTDDIPAGENHKTRPIIGRGP